MTYLYNRRKLLQPARRGVFLGEPDSPAHASTKMIRVSVRPPGLPTKPADGREPRPMAILPLPLEPRDPFGVEHDTRTELLGHQGQPVQRLEPFTPLPDNIQLVILDVLETADDDVGVVAQAVDETGRGRGPVWEQLADDDREGVWLGCCNLKLGLAPFSAPLRRGDHYGSTDVIRRPVYVGDALVPVLDLVESDDKFLCLVRQGDVIQEAVGGEPQIKSRLEHFRPEYCYDLHEKIRDVG